MALGPRVRSAQVAGVRDLTSNRVLHGSIGRALFALAAPVIAGEALHIAFHLIDVVWVGRLGAWATAAVMTSMYSVWMALSLANLVCIGLAAHVSRAIGAGDRTHAGHVVAQAIWLALGLSFLIVLLGGAGAQLLFRIVGTDPQLSAAGTGYLRTLALGMPFSFLYLTAGAAMRACGNTRVPMIVTGTFVLANAVLAPFLIYGVGPFPRLGVPGSALATVCCMAGAVVVYGILLARRHPDLPFNARSLARPDPATLASLVRVGAPYCAIGTLFSIVYLWYSHVLAPFGDAAIAVLGIGNRLESITYLTADGFAVATSTFVGQNLGAGNARRAERGAWRAVRIMSAIGAGLGLVFLIVPDPLLSAFTRDPEVLRIGVAYLRILSICQIFTGLEGAIGGGFAGAGNTVPPMIVHVFFGIVRIPLATWAVFGLGLGLYGVAWTMSLTCILRGIVLALWFRRGRWKEQKLHGVRPLPPSEEPEPTGV